MVELRKLKDPVRILNQFQDIYQQIGDLFAQYKEQEAKARQGKQRKGSHESDSSGVAVSYIMQPDDFIGILVYVLIQSKVNDVLAYVDFAVSFTLHQR